MVRTRDVGVRGNCFRHVRESSLEQSIKSMSTLQVVGRKVVGLENPLRLDVVGFQDVTQESRDVVRAVACKVLAALDGRATRGAGLGANKAAIIARGGATTIRFTCRSANFTSAMVLDEGDDDRELRENWSHHGQLERSECLQLLPGRTCLGVRHQGGRRLPHCVCPGKRGDLDCGCGDEDRADQEWSKGSSGFSDTLVVPVRPVGGYGCCVMQ